MTVSVTPLSHGTVSNGNLGTKTLGTGLIVIAVDALYIEGGNPTVASVSIAGVAATLLARCHGNGNGTDVAVEFWGAPCAVVSGNVTVNWNSGYLRGGYGLWRLTGALATPHDLATAIVDNPSVILDVPDGGAILAAAANAVGTSATTWSGLSIEDYDELCPPDNNTFHSGAHQAFASAASQTVSASIVGSSGRAMAAVSFAPDNTPPPPPPPPPPPVTQRIRVITPQFAHVNALIGDDNTGDGSSGNPWKTAEHAYGVFVDDYDFARWAPFDIILQTDSPFSNNIVGALTGRHGGVTFRGINPGITCTAMSLVNGQLVPTGYAMWSAGRGVVYQLADMIIRPTGQTQTGLNPAEGIIVPVGGVSIIGNNAASLVHSIGIGSKFAYALSFKIGGSANCGFLAENQATLQLNAPLIIEGSLVVGAGGGNAFCAVDLEAYCDAQGFSCSGGSVTGRRYIVPNPATIHTGTGSGALDIPGDPDFFPGTVPGVAKNGGHYE